MMMCAPRQQRGGISHSFLLFCLITKRVLNGITLASTVFSSARFLIPPGKEGRTDFDWFDSIDIWFRDSFSLSF
jgi:hypothetical protein